MVTFCTEPRSSRFVSPLMTVQNLASFEFVENESEDEDPDYFGEEDESEDEEECSDEETEDVDIGVENEETNPIGF